MTRLLAVESTGRSGSVALLEEGSLPDGLPTVTLPREVRTAQALAPAIRDLLDRAGWTPASLDVVAVAVGPGSFTGLRIGITAAKTLAYAVGADLVGVSTMATLVEPLPTTGRAWTVLDAQRGELFVAAFTPIVDMGWREVEPTQIVTPDAWLTQLASGDLVAGPIVARLADRLPAHVTLADDALQHPTAEGVARVAWRLYQAGHRDDIWQLVPHYYRRSAAEEKAG
jgi:tRNA threonylcarbamoyladenosine biosynthesis protein TsaB